MFCSNCGGNLQEGAAFCAGCGTKVGGAASVQQSVAPTTSHSQTVMVRDFRCNNCGSPLKIPNNSRAPVKCPSCKTECVIEGLLKNAEMADKENINSGVPLTASPSTLHRKLVSILIKSQNIPLDVFEKIEVVREEHHCVPAFYFYCNGTASFTYDAINIRQHKTSHDMGDKNVTKWENYEEATQMSGSANASAKVVASGNKAFGSQVRDLYMFLDDNKLDDFAELGFPYDVITHDYNFPQTASFNEYAKSYMEKLLEKNAVASLSGKNVRNLSLGGSRIDKDEVIRVFLGMYRIVFKYGDKEYSVWVSGDGEKAFHEGMPSDQQRQKTLEQKQNAKKEELASFRLPIAKVTLLSFLGVFCFTGGVFGMASLYSVVLLLLGLAGFIYCLVILVKIGKKNKTQRSAIESKHQNEIDSFKGELTSVIEQFKGNKKALRGIYEKVSGDASAF